MKLEISGKYEKVNDPRQKQLSYVEAQKTIQNWDEKLMNQDDIFVIKTLTKNHYLLWKKEENFN